MRTFLLKLLNTFSTPSPSVRSSHTKMVVVPPTLEHRRLITLLPGKGKIECPVMVTCQ